MSVDLPTLGLPTMFTNPALCVGESILINFFAKVLDFGEIVLTFASQYRGMEQLVARRAHNPKVTGSSPVPATRNPLYLKYLGFLLFGVFLPFFK